MDLDALAALKAQLEGESKTSLDTSSPTPDSHIDEEKVNAEQVKKLRESLQRAAQPHLLEADSELSDERLLCELLPNTVALWAVVANLENDLKIQIPDTAVSSWKTVGDILAAIKSQQS